MDELKMRALGPRWTGVADAVMEQKAAQNKIITSLVICTALLLRFAFITTVTFAQL